MGGVIAYAFRDRRPQRQMNELRDCVGELRRMAMLFALVVAGFSLVAGRLIWLQVVVHDKYAVQAEQNRIALIPIAPDRGLIFDRHGVVLASNAIAYTLEITRSMLRADLHSVIDELAKLVAIAPNDRKRFKRLLAEARDFSAIPIHTRLSDAEVARFTVQRFRFPGVEVRARSVRQYPQNEIASRVLGYIGHIDQRDIHAIEAEDDTANYRHTDHIGKEGLERSYERQLHGRTGYEAVERTAVGPALRTLSRVPPTPRMNLILSIDIDLQKVVEKAFGDYRGALVAIEPRSGAVLAYVSRPGFNLNVFVDGIDADRWNALITSSDQPLLNRSSSGTYPPGSTFKPFMALAALELGRRGPTQGIDDAGFFMLDGHRFNDDKRDGHGYVNLHHSLVLSCDTYYCQLGNELDIDAISGFMRQFGFGARTGIDLAHEKTSVLPSQAWKRERFRYKPSAQKWLGGDTVSISIGQGYNSYTMLQLAHAVAISANDGIIVQPPLVRMLEDRRTGRQTPVVSQTSGRIPLGKVNVESAKRAMVGVTTEREGTGFRVFRDASYVVAGKSGTAQVVGLKGARYNHKLPPERLCDNALFTAFAPAGHPKSRLRSWSRMRGEAPQWRRRS
jgi:penicillin-binding protein 2